MTRVLAVTAFLISLASPLDAFIFRHPESAEQHTVFFDAVFVSLSFERGFYSGLSTFACRADYMLPFRLPFSLGLYADFPDPNLKRFGARLGYHIDINDPKTDLYLLYVFALGFTRNTVLAEYGDETQEMRLYDFRAGIRRSLTRHTCLVLETGYKFQELIFGITVKTR